MKRATQPNMLLLELVIVLFFFSLSTAVILELFVAAHDQSVRAEADSALTLMAEDLADRFFASGLSGEAFFRAEGFEAVGAGFVKTDAARGRAVRLSLTGGARAGPSGTLDAYELTVLDGDTEVLRLPIARYRPEGGTR